VKPEDSKIGLAVRSRMDNERGVISTAVEVFCGTPMVVVKMGKRGNPRMEALDTLEPVEPTQKKGDSLNA
jgi:hypothetical protein